MCIYCILFLTKDDHPFYEPVHNYIKQQAEIQDSWWSICLLHPLCHEQDGTQGHLFLWNRAGLSLEFIYKTGCHTRIKELFVVLEV